MAEYQDVLPLLLASDSPANNIEAWQVCLGFGVVVAMSATAHQLQLGVALDLFVGGVRAVVQLSCLGYILTPLFAANCWYVVLAYVFGFMVLVSANEASARPKHTYRNIYRDCVFAIGTAVFFAGLLMMVLIAPDPWYKAQYVIPICGMLINGSLGSMAQALNFMISYFVERKEYLEIMLSFGATKWEASWQGFTDAYRTSLIPAINNMNVIGLVAIPGMMTGQVLGGSTPEKAARYQIVITFLIGGASFISVGLSNFLTIRAFFDENGRLDMGRASKQTRVKCDKLCSPQGLCGSRKSPAVLTQPLLEPSETVSEPLRLRPQCAGAAKGEAADAPVLLELDLRGRIANAKPVEVRLSLRAGQIVAIMGKSGIGKSTILKYICDLSAADTDSSMALGGVNIHSQNPSQWRRQVLYVHQSKAALPGTPLEFMERVQKLKINQDGVGEPWDFRGPMQAMGLPLETEGSAGSGKQDFAGKPWNELSGGEAQRMMIAIALATKPKVLLFDEPTSALDDESKRAFEKLVRDWTRNTGGGVILVTHDAQQAERLCDSVWTLSEGEAAMA